MSLVRQNARLQNKISTTAGATPSIAPSADHTDGTWSITNCYVGEIMLNTNDEKVWMMGASGPLQLYPGATSSTPTLAQVLKAGSTSGGNNISMGSRNSIKSVNGGGQIELDSTVNGGGPGSVYLSTDSGGFAEAGLFLEPGNGAYMYSYDSGIIVFETNTTGISLIDSGIDGTIKIQGDWLNLCGDSILIRGTTATVNCSNSTKTPVFIASQGSSVSAGVINSVILGGTSIGATYSNKVYLSQPVIAKTESAPGSSGAAGPIGEIRYDSTYLYIKTSSGWGRVLLDYGF